MFFGVFCKFYISQIKSAIEQLLNIPKTLNFSISAEK